jgi:hypothetical protein
MKKTATGLFARRRSKSIKASTIGDIHRDFESKTKISIRGSCPLHDSRSPDKFEKRVLPEVFSLGLLPW